MRKNMVMDPGDLKKVRVKKDLLWKPLLRGFRSYYRNKLNGYINMQWVVDPLRTDRTVYLEQSARRFLMDLGAPCHLVDDPMSQHGVIILSMPISARNMERYFLN